MITDTEGWSYVYCY